MLHPIASELMLTYIIYIGNTYILLDGGEPPGEKENV